MTTQEFIESIALPGEVWKDVVGREGCYIVSDYGRIATIRHYYHAARKGKIVRLKMKPHLCSTSIAPSTHYRRMTFNDRGIKSTELVHRVVAEAFIPNPHGYPTIDHIDDNPENNHADNLQWCTYKVNNSKPHHRIASSKAQKGKIDPKRKPLVALSNGVPVKFYTSMHEASLEGHIKSAIFRVLRGQLKTHHGYSWIYLSDYEKLVSMSKNSETIPGN